MIRDTFDFFTHNDRERGRFGDDEPKRGNAHSESRIELTLQLRQDRALALMVSDPSKGAQAKWVSLPKSLIEYEINAAMVKVDMPEALAREKGLL